VTFTLRDTVIDPAARVEINQLHGDAADQDSRIFPFKRMEGRQAFDTVSNRLAFNHAYGPGTDTAFWVNFDWAKSLQAGMDYVGEGFSGNFGFVDTTCIGRLRTWSPRRATRSIVPSAIRPVAAWPILPASMCPAAGWEWAASLVFWFS
jgi:hypothetical protein